MTRDAASFEQLYRDLVDPWDYETSAYEADKYQRSLQLLPRSRYGRGLEVGCSIGVMSTSIARRCDCLLGIDFAPTAINRAKAREVENARFEVASVPEGWPPGSWDLIVLSEVLYYLEPDALNRTSECVGRGLAPDGDCLSVSYTGPTETLLTSEEAGDRLLETVKRDREHHEIFSTSGPSWVATVFSSRHSKSSEVVGGI